MPSAGEIRISHPLADHLVPFMRASANVKWKSAEEGAEEGGAAG